LLQNDQHWPGVTGKETGVDYGTRQTEYSVHVHSEASLVGSRIGRNDIHIGALGRGSFYRGCFCDREKNEELPVHRGA
jgi:hypothetical protein